MSESSDELDDRVHLFELTTETPNKIISSSKIFENRKSDR